MLLFYFQKVKNFLDEKLGPKAKANAITSAEFLITKVKEEQEKPFKNELENNYESNFNKTNLNKDQKGQLTEF